MTACEDAAVDRHGGARDPAGAIASVEEHRLGDIGRHSVATARVERVDGVEHVNTEPAPSA